MNNQQINNYTPDNNKYTTIIVTVIIIVVLLCCGGIFSVIWAIMGNDTGLLFRSQSDSVQESETSKFGDWWENPPKEDNSEYFTEHDPFEGMSDYQIEKLFDKSYGEIITLNKYVPMQVEILGIAFYNGDYTEQGVLVTKVYNNSDNSVEFVLREDSNTEHNVYISEYNYGGYSTFLEPHEEKIVKYKIKSLFDDAGSIPSIKDKGNIKLSATIYIDEAVDWEDGDYHYLELTNGDVYWDESGEIYTINTMNTWGYCSSYDIIPNTYIE